MENIKMQNAEKLKVAKDHKVIIDNRKRTTITNVTKALSANDTSVVLQMQQSKIYITGKDLHLNKLDIEQGLAEIDGEIFSLKYSGATDNQGFLKRIFKW